MGIRLLPLFKRSLELLHEQGYGLPKTEDDAHDFIARGRGNVVDDMRIVVLSPTKVCAYSPTHGYTSALTILPEEGPEEVIVLGEICKAALRRCILNNSVT